jgi:hypothetical protein
VNQHKTTDTTGERIRTGAGHTPRAGRSRWLTIGAVAALLIVVCTVSGTAWAQQHAKHQLLWKACRACLVETPAGPTRAATVEGATPRIVSPYGAVSMAGLPAVAIVEGRIGALMPGLTTDGRGVFTDYELVVTRVVQTSALLPVAVGATIVVTRPGGEVERNGQRWVVSVAGYPTLAADAGVIVTLLAIPDAGSFQELSARLAAGKER